MYTITYDDTLIEEIAARFDLREPNKRALSDVVNALAVGSNSFQEMIADLATGVGKTFLMSSLVEYLAQQGVRNVLVVTPGSTIQRKTLENFNTASSKYVSGADISPYVVTPENFRATSVGTAMRDPDRLKIYVFNVQQLIRPTAKVSRKIRQDDENLGDALYSHLENAPDLFVIADEYHVYHEKAAAFSSAIRDLHPAALIGLTATPDASDHGKIVSQYTLGEAIADGYVKIPVIVYRKDGTKDEDTQLRDACQLLAHKEKSYSAYIAATAATADVRPVLFVVCQSIDHATEVGQILGGSGFIGDPEAVLEITSQSSDDALEALSIVEQPTSKIRAIVSVNMLREGWDVKNIAVIVALRRLASQTLTEQILGRGLRLPFGSRTRVPDVDQVDLVAHDSYRQLLEQKDVLRERIQLPSRAVPVDAHGAAVSATIDVELPISSSETNKGVSPPSTAGSPHPDQGILFGLDEADDEGAEEEGAAVLTFQETDTRLAMPQPEYRHRVVGAPQITFPRRQARLDYAPFNLSDIPDGDAEKAGAAFVKEIPTFIFREELRAERAGDDITISRVPLASETAQEAFTSIEIVREQLAYEIAQQREVPKEKATKGAAKRLVRAFLKGAGVTSESDSAEWGQKRRQQAVEGMRSLIRTAIAGRSKEIRYELLPEILPFEPVLVSGDLSDAYNSAYKKHPSQFSGWKRNIMPVASFDAKSTEWELAHLLDRDDEIAWWLRLYVHGAAFVPTPKDGRYYPDFVAVDREGTHWLIEGKADATAHDDSVIRKKEAAERWARAVRDDGDFGQWHYLFATETDIKQAAGSWNALLVTTKPE